MHPFWSSFIAFAVFLVAESILSWHFIRGSKKHHRVLWRHMGSPTLMRNADLIGAWKINKYLLRKKHAILQDVEARGFAERMRLPMLVSYFGSFVTVIIFLGCYFVFGKP